MPLDENASYKRLALTTNTAKAPVPPPISSAIGPKIRKGCIIGSAEPTMRSQTQ